jgi:hypothetical protein
MPTIAPPVGSVGRDDLPALPFILASENVQQVAMVSMDAAESADAGRCTVLGILALILHFAADSRGLVRPADTQCGPDTKPPSPRQSTPTAFATAATEASPSPTSSTS